MAPSFFWAAVSTYKPETPLFVSIVSLFFLTLWFDMTEVLSSLNNATGEITQMTFETGTGIIDYSSYWRLAAASQMPRNAFNRLLLMIYSITTAVVSLEQTVECVLLEL